MNNNEQKTLERYGLTKNEAMVYLAMLNTKDSSILRLSKSTGIKRSTIYLIIESLIKQKLVSVGLSGSKKIYLPENPEKILDIIENRKKDLNLIMPNLINKYSEQSQKPIVQFYEGKDALKKVYKEIQKSKTESLWYGSASSMEKDFPEFYYKFLDLQKNDKNFKGMRDIVNNTKFDKTYAKERNSIKKAKIKVKVLFDDLYFLNSDNIIYDNKLAILSINHNFFATIIESKAIADAYRCMYELAWQSAKWP